MALGDLMTSQFSQLLLAVSNHVIDGNVSSGGYHDDDVAYADLMSQRRDLDAASTGSNAIATVPTTMAYLPQTVVLCELRHAAFEASTPTGPSDSGLVSKWRPKYREQIREPGNENKGKPGKGFFTCYLLTSLSPRHKGHTYIGFTVNPLRRIRQHNGEIGRGAWRTKSRRPWGMVVCIYGFPTNVSALQFDWAWQHPQESAAVRQAAATFKSFSGVTNKIKLAYMMLALPAWQSLNITVNYFSTKYTNHSASCPSLPEQMKVKVSPMDELPCYTEPNEFEYKDDCDNLDEYDEVRDTCETVPETYPNEVVIVSADNLHSIIHEACHEQSEHIEEYGTRNLLFPNFSMISLL